MWTSLRLCRWASTAGVTAVAAVALGVVPAQADTAPVDGSLPVTVSSDALPTVQVNGVVWTQLVVGGTVYVGGNFTSARPAGAAPGANEVARSHLLAYDLVTGVLRPGFAPAMNGQVKDLAVSPDQRTLYASGMFTAVSGQTRYRVAAFDVDTGVLLSFRPAVNSTITAVSATSSTVFLTGNFSTVNGVARTKVAAVSASTGATLPFAATIPNGSGQAMTLAPDGGSVVVGGSFTSVNGSSSPGYGLARLDATTGASLPLPVNAYVRDGGTAAAILSLETDGQNFYGAGYVYGSGGNLEGSFAADWATGSLVWVEDCHGDTYSAFPAGGAVYQASHKHYCGNNGGFPQTTPWTFYRGTAVSKAATRLNTQDYLGYVDHRGQPSPTILNWYPAINAGTFTGKNQGPWSVSGTSQYVLMGGEFTQVNGMNQQGLVRFAVSAIAPDADGPRLSAADFRLVAAGAGAGSVRLSWRSNHDRDNETLTYRLYRSDQTSPPIATTTATAEFWQPQAMTFRDQNLPGGSSQRYRLTATDAFGNVAQSSWVTVTVPSSGTASAYAQRVLGDAPIAYWRLGELSGSTVLDATGFHPVTAGTGVAWGAAGAVVGDPDTAATFDGGTGAYATTGVIGNAQDAVSVEAWVRTTTTRGGKLVGFSNRSSGTSTLADRHLYMDNSGRLYFGIQSSTMQTVNSPAGYNNGAWHHVVGTYGEGAMRLYVDGALVAQRSDILYTRAYWGYWRIGGDRLSGWPNRPTSDFLAGSLDEVAVYNAVLAPQVVAAHRAAGVGGTPANQPPVASFTSSASGLTVAVNGSESSDPDGTVVSYAWNFGDGASAAGVSASHAYAAPGTYTITLIVTDNVGTTTSTSQQVTVTTPPPGGALAQDAFSRTVANGWGSADVGGAWASAGAAGSFSVDSQRGRHILGAGATAVSSLNAVSSTSTEVRVVVSADKVPAGSGALVHVQGRRATATDYYGARLRLQADGSVQLHVTRGNGSVVAGVVVPGLAFAAGDRLQVRLQVDGVSPTTVRAKVWKVGSDEPASWQTSMTDSTPSLQVPGSVGLGAYLFGTATNAPVVFTYDDFVAVPPV